MRSGPMAVSSWAQTASSIRLHKRASLKASERHRRRYGLSCSPGEGTNPDPVGWAEASDYGRLARNAYDRYAGSGPPAVGHRCDSPPRTGTGHRDAPPKSITPARSARSAQIMNYEF